MIEQFRLDKNADVMPETLNATVWGAVWRAFARCLTPALEGVATAIPSDVEASFLGYPGWAWTEHEDEVFKQGLLSMFRRFRVMRADFRALDAVIRAYGVADGKYYVLFANRPQDARKAEEYGVVLKKGFMLVVRDLNEARSRGLDAFLRAEWAVGLYNGIYSSAIQDMVVPVDGVGDVSYYTEGSQDGILS